MALAITPNSVVAAGGSLTVNPSTGAISATPSSATDFTLTRNNFVMGQAASRVVPGATSLSLRNHANSADNLIILDSGAATLTGQAGSGSGVAGAGHTFVTGAGGGGNAAGGGLTITLGVNTGTGASGKLTIASTSADGQTAMGVVHSLTHTFSTLTAPYGTSNSATRIFDVTANTDTSANGYAGILNAFIAHVNVNGAAGSSIVKAEAVSGVINILAAGDLGSGTYATDGEILQNFTQTITGTVRGVQGSIQINSTGSFTTAYGVEGVAITNTGSAGTFTNTAGGVRGYVEHNNTGTIGLITATQGEVNMISAGTVSGITTGLQGWIHNTGAVTYTGVVNAVWGLTALTGAAVASNAVYGVFAQLTTAGTTAGGTTNAALNAEVQWSSLTNPTGAIYAMQARWRVNATTPFVTVANAEALHIQAPNITAGNTITAGRGIHILNQGAATVTTAEAIRIDAQSGATNNVAIVSLGGQISLSSTSAAALFTSASQNLTISTTTSGTLFVTSAGAITHTSAAASVWTHSGGAWTLNSTSQNVTLATLTSGTIALNSAGLLNLTGVGASVWTPGDGSTFVFGTTTGTQIGTVGGAAGQKIGWWGAAPAVQPLFATGASHTVDQLITVLQTMGLLRQS